MRRRSTAVGAGSVSRPVDRRPSMAAKRSNSVPLPAPVDPLLEMRGLVADLGVVAVARQHEGVSRQAGEEALHRSDDGGEVAALELGVARTAREQRVAREEDGRALQLEAHRPGCVARGVDGAQAQTADLDDAVVVDHEVVAGQHLGVLLGHADVDPRIAHGWYGLDVVPVAVRLDHPPHVQPLTQLEQLLVFVGGIDEHGLARLLASDDEDVVVHRPHDELVDLGAGVVDVKGGGSHCRTAYGGRDLVWPVVPRPDSALTKRSSKFRPFVVASSVSSRPRGIAAVNFAFSEEQEELRKSVRRFLEDKSSETEVRRLMETGEGYDTSVWKQMGEQLGLQGLAIPEEFGGSGYGYVELIVVFEEMGRALLPAPYFSTVALAANALLASGDDAAKKEYLPGIASGETIATLALTEESGRWDEEGVQLQATKSGDGYTLDGTKMFVIDGHTANLIIVAGRTGGGVSLFAVEADASGLTRTPLTTMDQTRKQARLEFSGTPARLIGSEGEGWTALNKTLDLAAVAISAEEVGGAQKCLEMSVDYAKNRIQFGRPIGSFQAIKHKCADMLLEVESAKSAAYYAGWAAAEDSDELPVVASLAKAYCSDAYFHAAAENIQIHGGIGFTWEHPAHLYFKRAKSSELLLGDPTYHRELLAQRIGI